MKIIIPIIIGIIIAIGIGVYAITGVESSNTEIVENIVSGEADEEPKNFSIDLDEGIKFKEP